jgi:PIN domain
VIVYLDTSTVLRVLFQQGKRLAAWGRWEEAYSSELLGVEGRRAIDRLRLESALDDEGVARAQEELVRIEQSIHLIALTRAVLRRAAQPMATVVRTLDAMHLASAAILREGVGSHLVFATHDARQRTAARAFGFECIGV